MLTKKDVDRLWDLLEFAGNNHSYLSTLEHHDMCNLFILLFADDESSSVSADLDNQNQKQSYDDLTNPHQSQAINISEDDNVSIESSEVIVKQRSYTYVYSYKHLSSPLTRCSILSHNL